MCGIYGWQWRHNNKPTLTQRTLLASVLGMFNDNRGGDSWGWYSLNTGNFNKGLGDVRPEARFAAHHDSIICHTRKATTGEKTVENAHPWDFGHVIGAHNGQVYNHHEENAKREIAGKPKFNVDSMHIFDSLQESGTLGEIRGYGAIEWVDKRTDKNNIRICRVSQSADLQVVVTDHGVIWSSSSTHLKSALDVTGIWPHDKTFELKKGAIYIVSQGRLYETKEKLEFYEPPPPPSVTPSYYGAYGSQGSMINRMFGSGRGDEHDDRYEDFRVTNKIRKTIGRAALPSNGIAYLCKSCYRECNAKRACPRGHSDGVLEMKEATTWPVDTVVKK